jgi:hypothetical protein
LVELFDGGGEKMTKRLTRTLLLLLTIGAVGSPAAALVPRETPDPDEIVVVLKPGATIEAVNSRYRTHTLGVVNGTNIYKVQSDRASRTIARMRRDSSIVEAGKDSRIRRQQVIGVPFATPELVDPRDVPDMNEVFKGQLKQGQLSELGMDAADALVSGSTPVIVAVIDTGIDPRHETIARHLWHNEAESAPNSLPSVDDDGNGYVDDKIGYDFVEDNADPDETFSAGSLAGHGTFVAGLIALGAPNARIMPLRVLDGDGVGSSFDAAAAINYAVRHGARVINVSFGTENGRVSPILKRAIRSAYQLGVIVVAAAGNSGSEEIAFPASDDKHVIAVGSTDGSAPAEFSNFGTSIDVSAPGTSVLSAMPGTYDLEGTRFRYAKWSGTSFSSGLVAAAAATLLTANAVLSFDELKSRLRNSGDRVHGDHSVGKRVNFLEAVGGIFRDAGSLDRRTGADLTFADSTWQVGTVLTREIGKAERLAIHASFMSPGARLDVFAVALGLEEVIGRGVVDELGNFVFAASNNPKLDELVLPTSVANIEGILVKAQDGTLLYRASLAPGSGSLYSYGGVGMKASDPEAAPFGFVGFQFFAWSDTSAFQELKVSACGLTAGRTYVLRVGGEAISEAVCPDHSLTFLFVGQRPGDLPEAIDPVTKAGRVELRERDALGNETVVCAGDLSH